MNLQLLVKVGFFVEGGKWYKLHDCIQSKAGSPRIFGAVRLKLSGTDSDGRRTLYHQPIFKTHEGSAEMPKGLPQFSDCEATS